MKGLTIPQDVQLIPNFSHYENALYHFTKHIDMNKLKLLECADNYVQCNEFKFLKTQPFKTSGCNKYKFRNGIRYPNEWTVCEEVPVSKKDKIVWQPTNDTNYDVYFLGNKGYVKILQFIVQ
jgi:hypothetical protein